MNFFVNALGYEDKEALQKKCITLRLSIWKGKEMTIIPDV